MTATMCESRTAVMSPGNGKLRGTPRSPVSQTSAAGDHRQLEACGSTPTMVKVMPLMTRVLPMAVGRAAEQPIPEARRSRHGHRRGVWPDLRPPPSRGRVGPERPARRRSWPTPKPPARVAPRIDPVKRGGEVVEGGEAFEGAGRSRGRQSRKFAGATERSRVVPARSPTRPSVGRDRRYGSGLQDAAVQHREDRRVGADAERQRRHGRERENGMSKAEPQGEPKVGHVECCPPGLEARNSGFGSEGRIRSRCAHSVLLVLAVAANALPSLRRARRANPLAPEIDRLVQELNPQVVAWRRDFHEHPELGNRETRTSKVIADELRKLGFEVKTGVAHTGVVGVLRGGRATSPVPSSRCARTWTRCRSPSRSISRSSRRRRRSGTGRRWASCTPAATTTTWRSCLGRPRRSRGMRGQLPGTVKVIFQPAEEGPPPGETGRRRADGARRVCSTNPEGRRGVRPARVSVPRRHASPIDRARSWRAPTASLIKVQGRQTHGAVPWGGVDPIVVGSQIVMGLQTIISRTVNITEAPAVVTVGRFTGGNRSNIVPGHGRARRDHPRVQRERSARTSKARPRHRHATWPRARARPRRWSSRWAIR